MTRGCVAGDHLGFGAFPFFMRQSSPMSIVIGLVLIAAAIALFVTGLLAALRRSCDGTPRPATCLMLVLLRLAIGWHFFIEGVDKLHNPTWTSANYLREATGPLAPRFRALAGDTVVDMLTAPDDKTMPALLNQEWQDYLTVVDRYYSLDDAQAAKVRAAVDALKKQIAQLLTSKKKQVEMIAPYPPSLKVEMTIKERLKVLDQLQTEVVTIETGPMPDHTVAGVEDWKNLPHHTSDAAEAWKTAKANVSRWRGDLQKDLALINRDMKRTIRQALLDLVAEQMPEASRKKVEDAVRKLRRQADTDINGAYAKIFDKIKLAPGRTYVIDMESPDMDCYLRLEDGSGILLAEDLGSGRKARITHKVPGNKKSLDKQPDPKIANPDTYRIVAGSFNKAVGTFTLVCKDKVDDGKEKTDSTEEPKSEEDKKEPKKKTFEIGKPWTDKLTEDEKNLDPARRPADPLDWESIDRIKDKLDEKIADEFRKNIDPKTSDYFTTLVFDHVLAKRKKDQPALDPLPFTVARPWRQWSLLDWSDQIVKYGVLSVGLMLLLGLFTRLACLAGAGFLLMFFLAMPPLPGWPESPRSEGHYLYVNKNIIEMLALLVLATTPSGRWCGLDGLVQFFNPWRWRKPPGAGTMG
jgi:uncharacterized membrane protein YphA (DoxX/SURF4 family)